MDDLKYAIEMLAVAEELLEATKGNDKLHGSAATLYQHFRAEKRELTGEDILDPDPISLETFVCSVLFDMDYDDDEDEDISDTIEKFLNREKYIYGMEGSYLSILEKGEGLFDYAELNDSNRYRILLIYPAGEKIILDYLMPNKVN